MGLFCFSVFLSSSFQIKSKASALLHVLILLGNFDTNMQNHALVLNGLLATLNFLIYAKTKAASGECKKQRNTQASPGKFFSGA